MIRNLIFDFDGTLADTSRLIVATMKKTALDCELPYRDESQIKATIGVRLEEIPSILWPEFKGIGEKVSEKYRKNFEALKNEIPVTLFPGVKETLKTLKERGCRLAIATSRSHRSVTELTEKLGIEDLFTSLLGGNDVSRGKPDPESIFKILNENRWSPEESMMVGDMRVDILMGRNAGIVTCGVTYGNGDKFSLLDADADFIISKFNSLLELPPLIDR